MLNWPGMLEWDRGSITCSGVLGWDRIRYLPVQWSLAGPVCSRWLWSSLGWCENQLYPCMVSSWCHRILAHSWTSWNSLSFLYIIESSLIPEHHKTLMDITEFSLILEHHRILAHSWISQNCRLFLNIIESLLIPKPAGSSIISRRRRIPELSSLQGSLYLTIEWGISRVHEDPDRRHSKSKKVVCCTSHSKGWLGLWWSFYPATLTNIPFAGPSQQRSNYGKNWRTHSQYFLL